MKTERVSIVIPCYNEEKNIKPIWEEISEVINEFPCEFEVIFIDDGSRDDTLAEIRKVCSPDGKAKGIGLRKNYGQTAALAAGIRQAHGEVIITMDADLQNDPADIPLLLGKIEEGFDTVCGWRKDRKDPFLTKIVPSRIANAIIARVTGLHIHDYGCTLKAYRADFIKEIQLYGEMHRLIPAYLEQLGARQAEVIVNHRSRRSGKSKYGLFRSPKVILDLITAKFLGKYATRPIYPFGLTGLILCFSGVFFAVMTLYEKFFFNVWVHRNPKLLLAVMLFTIGIFLIMIGVIAEILVRAYHEIMRKPVYYVKEKINIPGE